MTDVATVQVPAAYTLAVPLDAVREIRREAGIYGNWTFQVDHVGEWLCAVLLRSNATVSWAALTWNGGQILQQWRELPASPEVPLFLPVRPLASESAADLTTIDLHGMKAADGGPTELVLSGLFAPFDRRVTTF